jgi:hypothetical protein
VHNSGLNETWPGIDKAERAIEIRSLHLGIQDQFGIATCAGLVNQGIKQRAANAPSPPCRWNAQATDMPIGQQASGTDNAAGGIIGNGVLAQRIELIPFNLGWNTLLGHKHRFT